MLAHKYMFDGALHDDTAIHHTTRYRDGHNHNLCDGVSRTTTRATQPAANSQNMAYNCDYNQSDWYTPCPCRT